jgi:hypothetical protein
MKGFSLLKSSCVTSDHGLVAEAVEGFKIEIGLGGVDRDLLDLRGRELG